MAVTKEDYSGLPGKEDRDLRSSTPRWVVDSKHFLAFLMVPCQAVHSIDEGWLSIKRLERK